MSMLLDLMQRLRSVPARDLPTIPRCVLHVVADHWNAKTGASWPKVETIAQEAGCSESAARLALADLVQAGWLAVIVKATPRDSARFEVRLDGRPIDSGCRNRAPRVPPRSTQNEIRVPPATTQGAVIEHPGCRHEAPRVPRGTPEALREPLREPAREPPNAREGGSIGPLFGPSPAALETPLPKSEVRAKKGSGEAKKKPALEKLPKKLAEDRYADAFEAGQKSQGFPITPLAGSDKKLLGVIAAAHARYRDDTPITGRELVQWFYQRARDFRGDKPDTTYLRGGSGPIGFRTWLDNGADGKPRPLAPGQEEPDEDDEDFPPPDEDLPPGYVEPPREELIATLERHGLHVGAQVLRENTGKQAAHG